MPPGWNPAWAQFLNPEPKPGGASFDPSVPTPAGDTSVAGFMGQVPSAVQPDVERQVGQIDESLDQLHSLMDEASSFKLPPSNKWMRQLGKALNPGYEKDRALREMSIKFKMMTEAAGKITELTQQRRLLSVDPLREQALTEAGQKLGNFAAQQWTDAQANLRLFAMEQERQQTGLPPLSQSERDVAFRAIVGMPQAAAVDPMLKARTDQAKAMQDLAEGPFSPQDLRAFFPDMPDEQFQAMERAHTEAEQRTATEQDIRKKQPKEPEALNPLKEWQSIEEQAKTLVTATSKMGKITTTTTDDMGAEKTTVKQGLVPTMEGDDAIRKVFQARIKQSPELAGVLAPYADVYLDPAQAADAEQQRVQQLIQEMEEGLSGDTTEAE